MDHKTSTYHNSESQVTAVTGEVRTLVVGWLVQWKNGPLILTVNEKRAKEAHAKVIGKDVSATIQKMTVHVDRFKELGKNLFTPLPNNLKPEKVVEWRNSIIKEWHQNVSDIKGANPTIVWNKIAIRYGISGMTANEFNQWVMDHMKYVMKVI